MAAAVLTACGGSDDGSTNNPVGPNGAAEGVYGGLAADGNAVRWVILEDNKIYAFFDDTPTSAFMVDGLLYGTGSSSNGSYNTTNAKIYTATEPPANVSITLSKTSATAISGTATDAIGPITFNAGPVAGSTYSYDTPAKLEDIAGSWSLSSSDGTTTGIPLVVAADGTFTASPPGSTTCFITGKIVPRPSGKNIFNTNATFGAGCGPNAGIKTTGIGIVFPLASGGAQVLFADVDSSSGAGDASFGTRGD